MLESLNLRIFSIFLKNSETKELIPEFLLKKTQGLKYFFVEQDSFENLGPIKSVEMSFNYLNKAELLL